MANGGGVDALAHDALADDALTDDVLDLGQDADVADEPPLAPRGLPRWACWPDVVPLWLRSPVALVVVVLAAAFGGAAVGSQHRAALDSDVALAQSVSVGAAYVGSQELRGGTVRAGVTFSLLNRGSRDVEVRLEGLTTPGQGTAAVPDAVRVAAGATNSAGLALDVQCPASGHAQEQAQGSQGTTALLAAVSDRDDNGVEVRLPLLDEVATSLAGQLTWACAGVASDGPTAGWLWLDGGGLRVSVSNPTSARSAVRLQLDASPGLGQRTEPALPLDLAPGETRVVDLTVAPDCSEVGVGPPSWLELQAVEPQGTTFALTAAGSSSRASATGTEQWLAHQLAQACSPL